MNKCCMSCKWGEPDRISGQIFCKTYDGGKYKLVTPDGVCEKWTDFTDIPDSAEIKKKTYRDLMKVAFPDFTSFTTCDDTCLDNVISEIDLVGVIQRFMDFARQAIERQIAEDVDRRVRDYIRRLSNPEYELVEPTMAGVDTVILKAKFSGGKVPRFIEGADSNG